MVEQNKNNYISVQDFEDVEHFSFINASQEMIPNCGLQTSSLQNSTTNAKDQCTELTNYSIFYLPRVLYHGRNICEVSDKQ